MHNALWENLVDEGSSQVFIITISVGSPNGAVFINLYSFPELKHCRCVYVKLVLNMPKSFRKPYYALSEKQKRRRIQISTDEEREDELVEDRDELENHANIYSVQAITQQ